MPTGQNRVIVFIFSLLLFFILGAYLYGAYSSPRNLWPLETLHGLIKQVVPSVSGKYDEFGRLTAFPSKNEVTCPTQANDTAVLLVIGQSNSANHAGKKFATRFPQNVFNYFEGRCYIAFSPLLGASGEGGEFITPLADKLISVGAYKTVVIVSSGISGTPISRWQKDGDLNEMLLSTLKDVNQKYKITQIIWHQGENDFINFTSAKNYIKSFNSLLESLAEIKVAVAVFVSVATKCGSNWRENNPTAIGQKQLIDNKKIFLGVDTDTLLADVDRQSDKCHFSESGQVKTASAYAEAIFKNIGKYR